MNAMHLTVEHLWQARRGGSQMPRQGGADSEYSGAAPWALPRRAEQLLDADKLGGFA